MFLHSFCINPDSRTNVVFMYQWMCAANNTNQFSNSINSTQRWCDNSQCWKRFLVYWYLNCAIYATFSLDSPWNISISIFLLISKISGELKRFLKKKKRTDLEWSVKYLRQWCCIPEQDFGYCLDDFTDLYFSRHRKILRQNSCD